MDKKKWYASRTVWVGIISVGIATYNSASVQFGLPPIPDVVYALLGVLGVYTRVTTTKVVG